jgi:hypothetical protein
MSEPCRVVYFFEDIAHERFVRTLVRRAAKEQDVELAEEIRNATHGSRVWPELQHFVRDLLGKQSKVPDVLIVVLDANCSKYTEVRKRIRNEVTTLVPCLVCAVPNPHIEKWYLADAAAFKKILPKSCPKLTRQKCERNRYKRLLKDAIRAAGVEPVLGGAEYGEELANAVDPTTVSKADKSFKAFWSDLKRALRSRATGVPG